MLDYHVLLIKLGQLIPLYFAENITGQKVESGDYKGQSCVLFQAASPGTHYREYAGHSRLSTSCLNRIHFSNDKVLHSYRTQAGEYFII